MGIVDFGLLQMQLLVSKCSLIPITMTLLGKEKEIANFMLNPLDIPKDWPHK